MTAIKTRIKKKTLTEAYSKAALKQCAQELVAHSKNPLEMLAVAQTHVKPHSSTMNSAVLSALAAIWIEFRLQSGAVSSGKLKELDREFTEQPQADRFLKVVARHMTGNIAEDRKIAGDVGLLLMAKQADPRKNLVEAINAWVLKI